MNKNKQKEYTIYSVTYKTLDPEYIMVSDINAIFEHAKDEIIIFHKMHFDKIFYKDDFTKDAKLYKMYVVKFTNNPENINLVICKEITDLFDTLEIIDTKYINSVEKIGNISYQLSNKEMDIDLENLRIG